MPEFILAENPGRNPWYGSSRRHRAAARKGHRRRGRRGRRRRNPVSNPRRGVGSMLTPGGLTRALDIETTAGIAAGLIGYQKVSEAIGQTGYMDAAVTILAAIVTEAVLPGNKIIDGATKGGIALGLLKVAMQIPGMQDLVSEGSVVLGGGRRRAAIGAVPGGRVTNFPTTGPTNKVTLVG